MSTSWDSTFVWCNSERLSVIAEAASVLVPLVLRQRLSINAFSIAGKTNLYSLECSGFRRGSVELRNAPLGVLAESLGKVPEVLMQAMGSRSANLALACIASRVVSRATWLRYSDQSFCSAVASFAEGELVHSDWAIDSDEFARPFLDAVRLELPNLRYVDDDLFRAVYSSEAIALPVMANNAFQRTLEDSRR
jgi:hypothetical protein